MATNINKIGVIGAGQMGNGISHVCAISKHDVYLMDNSEEILSNAIKKIDILRNTNLFDNTHPKYSSYTEATF